jgi:hypothetical protein
MKSDDIVAGIYDIGSFQLNVVASDRDNYFYCLLTCKSDLLYYINLVEDERFAIFNHIGAFSQKISESDMIEYNRYVDSITNKISQPVFLLGRHSIISIMDICQKIVKRTKKINENRPRVI